MNAESPYEFFAWLNTDTIPLIGERVTLETQPYKVVGLVYETRPVQSTGTLKHVSEFIEDGVHLQLVRVMK